MKGDRTVMESRTITITTAAIDHGNLNLSSCGRDFFPPDIFGTSSRKTGIGTPITIKPQGLNVPIKTDIPTDKTTGHPRWIFRERSWVKKFVRHNQLKPDDKIYLSKTIM